MLSFKRYVVQHGMASTSYIIIPTLYTHFHGEFRLKLIYHFLFIDVVNEMYARIWFASQYMNVNSVKEQHVLIFAFRSMECYVNINIICTTSTYNVYFALSISVCKCIELSKLNQNISDVLFTYSLSGADDSFFFLIFI